MWKHPSQTAACYLLSAALAAPKRMHMLIYVLRDGMWWRALAWPDVRFWTELAGENSKSFTSIQKCNVQGRQLA